MDNSSQIKNLPLEERKEDNIQEPPAITEPPTTTETPKTTDPFATEEPFATTNPYATEEPSATEEPPTTTDPYATTEPTTTTDPFAKEEPPTTTDPYATTEPTTTTDPFATTEPPTTTDPLATTEPPTRTDPFATTEPPTTREPPATTYPYDTQQNEEENIDKTLETASVISTDSLDCDKLNEFINDIIIDFEKKFESKELLFEYDEENDFKMKDGTVYTYLIKDMLNQCFGYYYDTTGETYNIRICIYKLNIDSKIPFLQFLMKKNNDSYKFMEYSYKSTLTSPVETNEYENDDFIQTLDSKLKEFFQEKIITGGMVPNVPPVVPNVPPTVPNVPPVVPNVEPVFPNVTPVDPNVPSTVPNVTPVDPNVEPTFPNVQPTLPNIEPVVPNVTSVYPNVPPTVPNVTPVYPNVQPAVDPYFTQPEPTNPEIQRETDEYEKEHDDWIKEDLDDGKYGYDSSNQYSDTPNYNYGETSYDQTSNIQSQFKGIITDYPNNNITVVLNIEEGIPSTYKFATLDEILIKKKINNISVDPTVISFLNEQSYLTTIYNKNLEPIQIPKVYYLCKEENGEYVNIENNKSNFIPRTFIKGKGNFFLFSETPILNNETRDLKQFQIIFDENGENVLKDDSGFFASFKPFDQNYMFNTFVNVNTKYLFLKSLEYVIDI